MKEKHEETNHFEVPSKTHNIDNDLSMSQNSTGRSEKSTLISIVLRPKELQILQHELVETTQVIIILKVERVDLQRIAGS